MPKITKIDAADNPICLICKNTNVSIVFKQRNKNIKRNHYKCNICECIFVPRRYHLNLALQKVRYAEHNNDPADPRYRKFLSKVTIPLVGLLKNCSSGIDYGSGPGPKAFCADLVKMPSMFERGSAFRSAPGLFFLALTQLARLQV